MTDRLINTLTLLFCMALLAAATFLPLPAWADTLTATMPTERVNGMALDEPVDEVRFYRDGEEIVVEQGPFSPGSQVSAQIAETCTSGVMWTATALIVGLDESDPSNAVEQPVDTVGCRPKSPTLGSGP